LTGIHYRDDINKAFVNLMLVLWTRILCVWTETPFRVGLALLIITLSAKGIGCMDWPDPPLMLILQEHVWHKLQKHTQMCSASSTTDAGWPRKRAHLGLRKNLSFCNQKTDPQLHLYVYGCFRRLKGHCLIFLSAIYQLFIEYFNIK